MKTPMAILGILLFLTGMGVGIYKSCYLESYWESTRWEQFAGHPWFTAVAIVLTLAGYGLIKWGTRD